jgi:putative SOS response-associated peptidase YedK
LVIVRGGAMCGRFNLRLSPAELQAFFDLFREPDVRVRYNIAPTQSVPTISVDEQGRREGRQRHWGLVPSWSKTAADAAKLINARSESAATKPAFRTAMRLHRCLIPASGFYEWQRVDNRTSQPWQITTRSGEPLAFAGLWERWTAPDDTTLESCTILTTAANGFMSELHDRMPVILSRELFGVWLDPTMTDAERLTPLLAPCPDVWLVRTPVSATVNNVRNDSPACLAPAVVQRSLFGDSPSAEVP